MRPKSGSNKNQVQKSKWDLWLWLLILLVIVGGIALNSYYNDVAWALRAAGAIVLAIVIIAIASLTAWGQHAWVFIKGARGELRKVVWPTRQETVQTTLVVVGMVVLTAIILWALDSVFLWAVAWITGQRG